MTYTGQALSVLRYFGEQTCSSFGQGGRWLLSSKIDYGDVWAFGRKRSRTFDDDSHMFETDVADIPHTCFGLVGLLSAGNVKESQLVLAWLLRNEHLGVHLGSIPPYDLAMLLWALIAADTTLRKQGFLPDNSLAQTILRIVDHTIAHGWLLNPDHGDMAVLTSPYLGFCCCVSGNEDTPYRTQFTHLLTETLKCVSIAQNTDGTWGHQGISQLRSTASGAFVLAFDLDRYIEHVNSAVSALLRDLRAATSPVPLLVQTQAFAALRQVKVAYRRWVQRKLDNCLSAATANEKGKRWEETMFYLLGLLPGISVSPEFQDIRTSHDEIDILLENDKSHPGLSELGSFILVECKNWKERTGTKEVQSFITKIRERRMKTGILATIAGLTGNSKTRDATLAINSAFLRDGIAVLPIEKRDVESFVRGKDITEILIEKYRNLLLQRL